MADMMLATKADYDAAVEATKDGGKPLVLDFTATWCPPCQRIGPIFVNHASEYPELTLKKVDVDANAEAAQAAGIQCMPTFKVFKNGECVKTMEGASPDGLKAMLDEAKA